MSTVVSLWLPSPVACLASCQLRRECVSVRVCCVCVRKRERVCVVCVCEKEREVGVIEKK